MISECEVGNKFVIPLQIMLCLTLLRMYHTENAGPNCAVAGDPVRLGKQLFSGRDLTNPWSRWRSVPLWWHVQPAGRCPISAEVIKQFKHSVCCGVSRESKFWSFL